MKNAAPILKITLALLVLMGAGFLVFIQLRNSAIQGCYEIAVAKTTTQGKSQTSDWSVETLKIETSVFNECLAKKGI